MSRVVGFHFRDYDARNAASNKLYYECGGTSAYEEGGSENYGYEAGYTLYITSDCTNVELAPQIPQRKLVAAMDVDTAFYCKMEKGKHRARKEHITIADFLQTDYEELLKLWLAYQATAVVAGDKELSSEVMKIAENC